MPAAELQRIVGSLEAALQRSHEACALAERVQAEATELMAAVQEASDAVSMSLSSNGEGG